MGGRGEEERGGVTGRRRIFRRLSKKRKRENKKWEFFNFFYLSILSSFSCLKACKKKECLFNVSEEEIFFISQVRRKSLNYYYCYYYLMPRMKTINELPGSGGLEEGGIPLESFLYRSTVIPPSYQLKKKKFRMKFIIRMRMVNRKKNIVEAEYIKKKNIIHTSLRFLNNTFITSPPTPLVGLHMICDVTNINGIYKKNEFN